MGGGKIQIVNELENYYTYGPFKPKITVEGEWVTIEIDNPTILSQEADYHKTVALCEKGNYSEARQILKTLIDKNPTNSEYHRIMGQIRSDEGDQDEAVDYLIDALRWDSKNGWALMMMGNILAKFKKDIPTALKYFDQALLANVNDYISLTNVAYLMFQQGKSNEAKRYLDASLQINPKYPNTHLILGLIAEKEQDLDSAFNYSLQTVCLCPKKDELYHNAVKQTFELARQIIKTGKGQKMVDQFRHKLEYEGDTGIEMIEDADIKTAAKFELAENFNRAKHTVRYKPNYAGVEHLILHELSHLKLIIDARNEGINQLFISTQQQKTEFLSNYDGHATGLTKKGFPGTTVNEFLLMLFEGLNLQVYNTPIDLFIENTIYHEYPEFRPWQFLSLYSLIEQGIVAVTNKRIIELAPKDILSKSKIYNLINAMQYRDLFGVDLIVQFNATPVELKQAQTFYNEYLEYRDDKKPGEEYEMLLHWAEDLKVDRYSELVGEIQYRKRSNINSFISSLEKDPLGLDERDPVKEREQRRFKQSQEKEGANMAVVMHMVSALQYFQNLPKETIKKIAFDIAMQGTQGFSTEKSGYTVPSIPDKEFTGYQILAWYYVSWAISAPLQLAELGLPYEKEFELAKKMGE
jgi:tetratricopeptide (TPR) repeat protein